MNFELTDEEYQTLKDIFDDWGSDCPYTDCDKRQALGEKLGILEPIPPPTEEELKKQEEFRNSPTGLMLAALMKQSNHFMQKIAEDLIKDNAFMSGEQWEDKIGTELKIRIPNNYNIKKE